MSEINQEVLSINTYLMKWALLTTYLLRSLKIDSALFLSCSYAALIGKIVFPKFFFLSRAINDRIFSLQTITLHVTPFCVIAKSKEILHVLNPTKFYIMVRGPIFGKHW